MTEGNGAEPKQGGEDTGSRRMAGQLIVSEHRRESTEGQDRILQSDEGRRLAGTRHSRAMRVRTCNASSV